MKNKELDEIKPVYIHEACYSTDNEINLLDLALVLIRKKMLIGTILTIFIAAGALYSLTQADIVTTTYDYETSILIGSRTVNSRTVYLEPPATLLSNIQYIYIPRILSGGEYKYAVSATLPPDSGVIILKTNSTKADDADAINLLKIISTEAIADHDKYYESLKSSLTAAKTSATPHGANLMPFDTQKNPTDIALQLASLKKSSTLDKPIITEVASETTSKSPKLIMAISIFGGLFFAIFAAFFAEFISKVKEKQNEAAGHNK